ncbi:hypothetical protein GCM10007301_31520 [Azorhizobium oxalatiphilum]|uniref:DUF2569 domain-containing protein n=1 Tax=Azorhizobium oxalatiphilum TaxID=980631 RepID=A0A917C3W7_9HYPH|nr:hypothetical protein [Azorhizobium oxalatiphilum]GGF69554.1 hypothetical protein GCM10007301_31520 [Azorhizobium oxalatiphilum]
MSAIPPVSRRRRSSAEGALGGMLAIIFWCTCGIVAVPLAGLFTLISALGTGGALSSIVDSVSGSSISTQMLRFGLVPQALLFLWSVMFVVMTVMRSRHALSIAPVLLVVWLAVTAFCQFSIRGLVLPEGATIMDLATLMPGLLSQAIGVVAFVGYFKEGVRPKAFYVR